MPTEFRCPHCGQTYNLTPEQVPQYAGQNITCTACQKSFVVQLSAAPGTPLPPLAYGGAMPPQYIQPTEPNGAATASVVFGILSLFVPVVLSIIAIICAIFGMRKAGDPRVKGKGQAIAGLVLGCVSITCTPLLISILLPALSAAPHRADAVRCTVNLKQIGDALDRCAADNNRQYPADLSVLVEKYGLSAETLICPGSLDTVAPGKTPSEIAVGIHEHCSYLYRPGLRTGDSADAIILAEPLGHHGERGANVRYFDGRTQWVDASRAGELLRELR